MRNFTSMLYNEVMSKEVGAGERFDIFLDSAANQKIPRCFNYGKVTKTSQLLIS